MYSTGGQRRASLLARGVNPDLDMLSGVHVQLGGDIALDLPTVGSGPVGWYPRDAPFRRRGCRLRGAFQQRRRGLVPALLSALLLHACVIRPPARDDRERQPGDGEGSDKHGERNGLGPIDRPAERTAVAPE